MRPEKRERAPGGAPRQGKRAGLAWDAILGAALSQTHKPRPEAYLLTAEALMAPPERVLMVAAHNGDLRAARDWRLRRALVARPTEHGTTQTTDLGPLIFTGLADPLDV